ncbi:hypothetical protein [Streptomyces sparsus]
MRFSAVALNLTLVGDGRVQIGYGDGVGGENLRSQGASATVGIENLGGARASQHSYN